MLKEESIIGSPNSSNKQPTFVSDEKEKTINITGQKRNFQEISAKKECLNETTESSNKRLQLMKRHPDNALDDSNDIEYNNNGELKAMDKSSSCGEKSDGVIFGNNIAKNKFVHNHKIQHKDDVFSKPNHNGVKILLIDLDSSSNNHVNTSSNQTNNSQQQQQQPLLPVQQINVITGEETVGSETFWEICRRHQYYFRKAFTHEEKLLVMEKIITAIESLGGSFAIRSADNGISVLSRNDLCNILLRMYEEGIFINKDDERDNEAEHSDSIPDKQDISKCPVSTNGSNVTASENLSKFSVARMPEHMYKNDTAHPCSKSLQQKQDLKPNSLLDLGRICTEQLEQMNYSKSVIDSNTNHLENDNSYAGTSLKNLHRPCKLQKNDIVVNCLPTDRVDGIRALQHLCMKSLETFRDVAQSSARDLVLDHIINSLVSLDPPCRILECLNGNDYIELSRAKAKNFVLNIMQKVLEDTPGDLHVLYEQDSEDGFYAAVTDRQQSISKLRAHDIVVNDATVLTNGIAALQLLCTNCLEQFAQSNNTNARREQLIDDILRDFILLDPPGRLIEQQTNIFSKVSLENARLFISRVMHTAVQSSMNHPVSYPSRKATESFSTNSTILKSNENDSRVGTASDVVVNKCYDDFQPGQAPLQKVCLDSLDGSSNGDSISDHVQVAETLVQKLSAQKKVGQIIGGAGYACVRTGSEKCKIAPRDVADTASTALSNGIVAPALHRRISGDSANSKYPMKSMSNALKHSAFNQANMRVFKNPLDLVAGAAHLVANNTHECFVGGNNKKDPETKLEQKSRNGLLSSNERKDDTLDRRESEETVNMANDIVVNCATESKGTLVFHNICKRQWQARKCTKYSEVQSITTKILKCVSALKPPGRFVLQDGNKTTLLTEKKVKEYVQAIVQRAFELVQKAEPLPIELFMAQECIRRLVTTRKKGKPRTKEEAAKHCREPHRNDVLFDRGRRNYGHPGNVYYREVCHEAYSLFLKTQNWPKSDFTKLVIERVRGQDPPGRFMKISKENVWMDLEESVVRVKITQTLRDMRRWERSQIEKFSKST